MKILLANKTYIKPEIESQNPEKSGGKYNIYGYRWNRNEAQWGRFCMLFIFDEYGWVDDSELPIVKRIEE